jgi:hypothetical protein
MKGISQWDIRYRRELRDKMSWRVVETLQAAIAQTGSPPYAIFLVDDPEHRQVLCAAAVTKDDTINTVRRLGRWQSLIDELDALPSIPDTFPVDYVCQRRCHAEYGQRTQGKGIGRHEAQGPLWLWPGVRDSELSRLIAFPARLRCVVGF